MILLNGMITPLSLAIPNTTHIMSKSVCRFWSNRSFNSFSSVHTRTSQHFSFEKYIYISVMWMRESSKVLRFKIINSFAPVVSLTPKAPTSWKAPTGACASYDTIYGRKDWAARSRSWAWWSSHQLVQDPQMPLRPPLRSRSLTFVQTCLKGLALEN